jgi:hypothetical protein
MAGFITRASVTNSATHPQTVVLVNLEDLSTWKTLFLQALHISYRPFPRNEAQSDRPILTTWTVKLSLIAQSCGVTSAPLGMVLETRLGNFWIWSLWLLIRFWNGVTVNR